MNKRIATLALVGATVVGVAAWAEPGVRGDREGRMPGPRMQPGGPGGLRGPGGPGGPGEVDRGEILKRVLGNPEIAKKAGVTEEQIRKIKASQLEFEKKSITLRAEAELARLEMRQLMDADKTDRDAIGKAFDAVAAKETALRKAEMLRMFDVKDALGDETLDKIKGMVREHLAKRMAHAGGTPGERPMLQRRMDGQGPHGFAPPGDQNARPWLRGQPRGGPGGRPTPPPPPDAPRN